MAASVHSRACMSRAKSTAPVSVPRIVAWPLCPQEQEPQKCERHLLGSSGEGGNLWSIPIFLRLYARSKVLQDYNIVSGISPSQRASSFGAQPADGSWACLFETVLMEALHSVLLWTVPLSLPSCSVSCERDGICCHLLLAFCYCSLSLSAEVFMFLPL